MMRCVTIDEVWQRPGRGHQLTERGGGQSRREEVRGIRALSTTELPASSTKRAVTIVSSRPDKKVRSKGGRYYTELASADYYTSGGESHGVWHENAAARAFGVSGIALKEDLERLFDGYHPETGEALAQNHGKADRRAAIDLCLSVPKDVSALWAVSNDKERRLIEAAFDRAVDETLRYVSDEFGATRRGRGGYEREHADLLVAIFTHRQSRGQDPQLHAHCFVLNTARREDGSPGTIDAGPLLQAKKTIGAYFRSALANELGITLEADQKFSFRVAGVPEALSEHWSSRANEIEAQARARGVGGGAAKAYVALEPRRAKDERPLAEVKEEWRETARQHGFDAHDVERIFGRPRQALTPSRVVETIDQALQVAVEPLTSEPAHFTKADLTRAVLIAPAPDGIAPREVLNRVEETLGHERFLALGDRRFTTKEIDHGIERAALEAAKRLGYKHHRGPCRSGESTRRSFKSPG